MKQTMQLNKNPSRLKLLALLVAVIILAVTVSLFAWYRYQLTPVDAASTDVETVEVTEQMTYDQLTSLLKERQLIRSELAFGINARLAGKRDSLKVGACYISKSQTSEEILRNLTGECASRAYRVITFFPGATIERPVFKSAHADDIDQDKMYIKGVLRSAGYGDDEISSALNAHYDSPLFVDKPAGTSLEGYVFGETYHVAPNASAEEVLETTFAEMYSQIEQHDIVTGLERQGLNLYEGITLASIVQRELNCEGKPTQERRDSCYTYQQGIAQVFLKRLREGMTLGSDVTFIYAADQLGVTPTTDIDSPYNTRINPGLPPGPIASPGILSLRAVANPAQANNLFFIAGDDGLIYFAEDNAGHEANIANHCQVLCSEL